MKIVDTYEYVTMLKELTEEGREVSMLISGSSMSPFLGDKRDTICFRKPTGELRKGDMVFYQRQSGQYVMHRICRIKDGKYYIVGDAQQEIEGPVDRDQIFAVITKVQRKGKWIGPENFWWKFFAGPWIWLLPWRYKIVRLYGKLRSVHSDPV